LTLDLQGLTVITPWKSPNESVARVWVFLPNTSEHGMVPHRATLVLKKGSCAAEDWKPDVHSPNESGVWNLEGYVLSVYREGVKESPDHLLTWGDGKEPLPWESLRWVLDLNRIVPNGRIANDPFENHHAIAAIKLSDGGLNGVAPRGPLPGQVWVVQPATPAYEQAFTDTVRYTVDLKNSPAELHLDPVPGGSKPRKRIRVVTTQPVTATVMHLPQRPSHHGSGHASAAAALMDKASRDVVASITVTPSSITGDMGGDPLCDVIRVNIPLPVGPCILCPIELKSAGIIVE
jgi:hypothetical protein